jgi:tryptophanyl-tRNA synthetase
MTAKKIMLSAVQPTNRLHLGNYLGALLNWVALQDQYDCLFFAVDLHSITVRQNPEELRENTYRTIATYIAAGISPETSTLFVQSHVPEHAELCWILTCFAGMGELARMTQFKDKSAKMAEEHIPAGLFTYPVLMAADILLYKTNLVPVGADQKQHLELARNLAERLNSFLKDDVLVVPEVFTPPVGARIMSLTEPQNKMSKSDPNAKSAVFLDDSDKDIVKKIKSAVTDSGSQVGEKDLSAGLLNLISMQAAIRKMSVTAVHAEYVGKQYGALKGETAEIVLQAVKPLRDQTEELLKDRPALDKILKRGAESAKARAGKTLSEIYARLGFLPR